MVGQLCIAEQALIGGVIDHPSLVIERPSKDAERIEIRALASIVEPENTVAVGEPTRHGRPNDVIIAAILGHHIIGDEDNDIPVPVNLIHVRIAGLNLGRVGTIEDPRPCTRRQELSELGRVLHRRIVNVTGYSHPEEFRVSCKSNVSSESFENASRSTPRGALEKDPHSLLEDIVA
jgi:hypothetical protein